MSKVKEAINKLTKELNAHNYNYYVLSSPTISDYDFDLLIKEASRFRRKASRVCRR